MPSRFKKRVEDVLACIEIRPMSKAEVVEMTGYSRAEIDSTLTVLKRRGKAVCDGKGKASTWSSADKCPTGIPAKADTPKNSRKKFYLVTGRRDPWFFEPEKFHELLHSEEFEVGDSIMLVEVVREYTVKEQQVQTINVLE